MGKGILRRLTAGFLALVLLASSGCTGKDDKDTEIISQMPEAFIGAIASEDEAAMEELADGFDYDRLKTSIIYGSTLPDSYDIMLHAASRAQAAPSGEAVFDREAETAKMEFTFTYIPLESLNDSLPSRYMSQEELYAAVDSFSDMAEKTIIVKFTYDHDEDVWHISRKSARSIYRLLTDGLESLPRPVDLTPDEAVQMFADYFSGLAEGNFDSPDAEFDLDSCRIYDNFYENVYADEEALDAVRGFVSAYAGFVCDNGPAVRSSRSEPYDLAVTGYAPSSEDLFDLLTTDSFLTQCYRYDYLAEAGSMTEEQMWSQKVKLIYETLTEGIDGCRREEYELSAYAEPRDHEGVEHPLVITGSIIAPAHYGYYEAEHSVAMDQYLRCHEIAAGELLAEGLIDRDTYDIFVAEMAEDASIVMPGDRVSPNGHPDQAVGTVVQVPEWCTDGSLAYGTSSPDVNGFWMQFTKFTGVLDTACYYVDSDGIWITSWFEDPFARGTELIVDWWIDGEQVVDTEIIEVTGYPANAVEVFLPFSDGTANHMYEMRLWEDNHTHVLSYVTIYGGRIPES